MGSAGSVGFWGTSLVGKGASSLSGSAGVSSSSSSTVASGLFCLTVASSSSGLTSWVVLGQR